MFLKSLTLRGFKSFADKFTLDFQPGISIVVGPNGSGKSNIVDSVSWVLGEQGPRSLRGGKMEDVIFAGSRLRPALGMAEVTLTIDNSAGVLPIDFSEVTISRTLFRSGDSDYRLNGQSCRLLDIQEMLSDTGVGREQHTIIGQGQLDAILTADPMTIRGFIEEAAGVAKHRRRKERALRKIVSTEQNLARLSDLLSEIRRQLRPLREQAEVAKRHARFQEDFDAIELIQAAREYASILNQIGPGGTADLETPIRNAEAQLSELEESLAGVEARRAEAYQKADETRDAAWSLAKSEQRLRSILSVAAERQRALVSELAAMTAAAAQARIDEIDSELTSLSESLGELEAVEGKAAEHVARIEGEVETVRKDLLQADEKLASARAEHAEKTAEVVRISGAAAAMQASLDAAKLDLARLADRKSAIQSNLAKATEAEQSAADESQSLESEEVPVQSALTKSEAQLAELADALRVASAEELEAVSNAATWKARADIRTSGSSQHVERLKGLPGVIGVLSDLIDLDGDLARALDAIAGPADRVLVVESPSHAAEVFKALQPQDSVGILVASGSRPVITSAQPLLDLAEPKHESLEGALSNVFVAGSEAEAADLAAQYPQALFVTRTGAVATGKSLCRGPSDAAEKAQEAGKALAVVRESKRETEIRHEEVLNECERLRSELNRLDSRMAASAERVVASSRETHGLERELAVVSESESESERVTKALRERFESTAQSVQRVEAAAASAGETSKQLQSEHARIAAASSVASEKLTDARMAAAKLAERRRLINQRETRLTEDLESARKAAGTLESRRQEAQDAIGAVQEIVKRAGTLVSSALQWSTDAENLYQTSREQAHDLDAQAQELRTQRAGIAGALDDLRSKARSEDLVATESRVRARILEERFAERWSIEPAKAAELYGHVWEVEDESRLTEPLERYAASDDETLRRRRNRVERDMLAVGAINPLAEKEFSALTDREEFLESQIGDVRASRRNLLKVVKEVDAKVEELFTLAFKDVAREFEALFAGLFPGGQGRLRLSEPKDLLSTGVHVEARPGGKNLRRLSLLSGGEKALSALAFLFAIFRARPSPFYVLDEVEAALDDVNLSRFLNLLREFRRTSQLIVVTHQKRTMEAADILYGVSIRPDGASRAISQRLNEDEFEELISEEAQQEERR